ncbi:MAG: hypothetical protein M1826_002649 [Phylliscum demangeonii]|nr:MAG: hypothetical protein M1826_002649 [Phylliscum demangeonii]
MTDTLLSDEVAEDYKNSLEDLTFNSKFEITNLTVIAKENMDHALAISRVTEDHIRNAPPSRKLPALYVLDSVVKNVGTPYTLFFGRNLYQTFMNAYTLVDAPIRKKLEEMLKTWKEPVPGSLDTRPVFPAEVTRHIENALIKARTAAVQMQQQQAKTFQTRYSGAWRDASTPPPGARGLRMNNHPGHQLPDYMQQHSYPPHQSSSGQLLSDSNRPAGMHPDGAPPASDIDVLSNDLNHLISTAQAEFAANPYDHGVQQRLKALLDLQTILHSQHLPPDQIQLIRNQVAQLSPESPAEFQPAPASTMHYPMPPVAAPVAGSLPEPVPRVQESVASILPPNALAALLASATASRAPPLSPIPSSQPTIPVTQTHHYPSLPRPAPAPAPTVAPPPPDGSSLLASLRAAGMLPGGTAASTSPNAATSSAAALSYLKLPFSAPAQAGRLPGANGANSAPENPAESRYLKADIPSDLRLTSAALKIPHPELVSYLYERQPNQCSTCGRRFLSNEVGKKRKARHLDWHFRVNIRMAEAVKRGQNRSWYVDEMEWIKSRDDDNDEQGSSGGGSGGTGPTTAADGKNGVALNAKDELAAKKKAAAWIAVPNEPNVANTTCPICQERFETVWHDEAQEWVWMDAVKIGGRAYHATCHAEAARDGNASQPPNGRSSRTLTPEPAAVLGKRKAEASLDAESVPLKARVKRELVTA